MWHSIRAEGFGVRLRPVRLDDAAFVVWLRNLDHAKGRVGDSATDVASQQAWLKTYFEREGDYYFVVETLGGFSVGACGIYGVKGTSAEFGRWIIRREAPAAIPSAIVVYDLAFGELGLSELRTRTVSTNQHVLSLVVKFGFRRTHVQLAGQIIGGEAVDMVHFFLTAGDWAKVRERLMPFGRLAEAQVREWEKTQLGKTQPWNETKKELAV